MTVPCALVGAALPGGLAIKRATMRGVESQGMLCSARELGLVRRRERACSRSPPTRRSARDLREALELDDALFTLKLTPNRADCLSLARRRARGRRAHRRAAVAAATSRTVPATSDATRAGARSRTPQACPRFAARVIDGIDARAPTPAWMQQRLERCGSARISALVDVTNYVMLELGQPLHVYDDATSSTAAIVVRFARAGETLKLLNDQVLELDAAICCSSADDAKPLGLAGIMGGEHSGIADDTTRRVPRRRVLQSRR